MAKAIKASHGPSVSPQSQAEEKVKKTLENPPECSFGQAKVRFQGSKSSEHTTRLWTAKGAIQVSECSGNGKTLKTGISDLENLKSEASPKNQESVQMGQVCITVMSLIHEEWNPDERNNDWSLDERNDEWSCVGWHEDCERLCNTSADTFARSFSFEDQKGRMRTWTHSSHSK